MVVPSRAELLPYIVLEAAAAGIPLVTTKVGGIPEIFGSRSSELVPPSDPAALARAIELRLCNPADQRAAAARLQERVRESFSTGTMTEAVLAA